MTPERAAISADDLRRCIAERRDSLDRELGRATSGMAVGAVHKTRVAARGLRSVLGTLRPLLRPSLLRRIRRDLRDLALEFEDVRAADVRRAWLDRLAAAEGTLAPDARRQLVARLEEARSQAHSALSVRLQSADFHERRERLLRGLGDPRLVAARGDVAATLACALRRRWKRLRKAMKHGWCDDDVDALHALRLAAKHARYASESLMPLLGLDPLPVVRPLKRLQDCLGEYRDALEALGWLDGLGGPQGEALRAQLRDPVGHVVHRRLKQLRRRAAGVDTRGVEMLLAAAAVSPARRRRSARSARS